MSEYTPSTEDIKWEYKEQCNHYYADCLVPAKEHAAEFDRWLAQHDAEVAEAERKRIIGLLKSHIYRQTEYVCSCRIDDDYPATMSVDEWVEHICTYQGENK